MTEDGNYYSFPDGFLWGSGISDYQAFGGAKCDLPIRWGATHFDHYAEDFDLITRKLHHNAFRTAIEWARIEPKDGEINKDAIRYYHKYLGSLRGTGVKTFVALLDFTNPVWVQEQGGWLSKKTLDRFCRYLELVSREFGEHVDYFLIANDPASFALQSYFVGTSPDRGMPPFHNDFAEAMICLQNLTADIVEGSDILHSNTKAKVGFSNYYGAFMPLNSNNKAHKDSTFLANEAFTYHVPDATKKKVDFIGIEHYSRLVLAEDNKVARTEVYPQGIRESANDLHKRYKLPSTIIENAYPTRDNDEKIYMLEHLKELYKVIYEDKINVIGYNW